MWLALAKGSWSRLLRDLIYSLSRWFCFPEEKAPEGLLPDRGPNYWEIYQCLCCLQLWRLQDMGAKTKEQKTKSWGCWFYCGQFWTCWSRNSCIVCKIRNLMFKFAKRTQDFTRVVESPMPSTAELNTHITILPLKIIKHLKEQIIGIPVYPVYIHSTSVWLYSRFIIVNLGENNFKHQQHNHQRRRKKNFCKMYQRAGNRVHFEPLSRLCQRLPEAWKNEFQRLGTGLQQVRAERCWKASLDFSCLVSCGKRLVHQSPCLCVFFSDYGSWIVKHQVINQMNWRSIGSGLKVVEAATIGFGKHTVFGSIF